MHTFDGHLGRVAVGDSAGGAYEIDQRREVAAFAVGQRATPEHPTVRELAHIADQLTDGARLSDPGLAADRDGRPDGRSRSCRGWLRPGGRPAVSRPTNGASSPRPSCPVLVGRRADQLVRGDRLTLALEPQRCAAPATRPSVMVATAVSRPAKIEPTAAASDSREAVFTVSPTTVYDSDACTPASTSPVLRPTRSPSRRPPPSSSATSRPTSRCMLTAARTARSASSSWAVGAPKTAMIPSPVSLSTWPPTSTTTRASAASTRSVTSPTRSGSRSSAQEVKSDRSPNSTVTTRRSAPSSTRSVVSGMPQTWQKRALATVGVEQVGQRSGPMDAVDVLGGGGGGLVTISPGARRCSRGWHRPCVRRARWPGWE